MALNIFLQERRREADRQTTAHPRFHQVLRVSGPGAGGRLSLPLRPPRALGGEHVAIWSRKDNVQGVLLCFSPHKLCSKTVFSFRGV